MSRSFTVVNCSDDCSLTVCLEHKICAEKQEESNEKLKNNKTQHVN